MEFPEKVLLIDIDGLRPDVFRAALQAGKIPNLVALVGEGLDVAITAPAPSITFCSQASLFTGAHPADHGIPGNQFFDRFGDSSGGVPRHFAFDVGDTLAVDDAVRVFTEGLAADRLRVRTIYERLAEAGWSSVVAGNMYAAGATTWLRPSLVDIARFTKGGKLAGMASREYDQQIVDRLCEFIVDHGMPDLTTLYFMGLDHDSHAYGPHPAQLDYLVTHVDAMVGQVWRTVTAAGGPAPMVAMFSDHGQIGVIPDDAHSLKIGFPFDKEMGHLFTALGLDVHDFPGEDPHCDAVMALNGGLAYVYLQNRQGCWADPPDFARDVLPVARAFWEAHSHGRYAPELHGALAGVFLRDVESEGWSAGYRALTPSGDIVSLQDWFESRPAEDQLDPVRRLERHAGRYTGDLILVSNYAQGYYFGGETTGVHGGLHPEDSWATLCYGWPGSAPADWEAAVGRILAAIEARCAAEGGRLPSVCDLVVGLEAALRM